ncbi:ribonucleases P/MRP protein subunit POP1 domain-containing protein [Trichoderma novae-zelandiae]
MFPEPKHHRASDLGQSAKHTGLCKAPHLAIKMAPNHPTGGQSASASKKRGPPAHNARSDAFLQKRAKVYAARSIPTQAADAALKDGELDLVAFVAAHEFEIRALEQSMATTKAVRSSRAFQQVPRGLRRRTASHNPKRVPRRLRARARKEMDEDNTPLVESRKRKPRTTRARIRAQTAKRLRILSARKKKRKQKKSQEPSNDENQHDPKEPAAKDVDVVGRAPRPKIRRNALNEPPRPPAKFRKRQINKTWLPTHQWHAKRARMTEPKEPLWRFAIPLTPNEKIYRPTHRAQGERGTMVWDMTYMSTIGLYGNFAGMARVLRRIGVTSDSCWDDRGSKWRQGTRAWTGILSRERAGFQRPVCHSTVIWDPEPPPQDVEEDGAEGAGEQRSGNEKKTQRRVFIRVHPSAFLELFNELLRLIKMETPRLYIEDLRFEIGSIELSGPASTEALLSVLTAYPSGGSGPKNKHAELFASLKGLTNPAALPSNSVLHFAVQDPRLRYPPRKMEFPENEQAQMDLLATIASWPSEENLQPSLLFDRHARHRASCLPSQKSINRRRSKVTPGTLLKPTIVDPPVPITLIASRSAPGTQAQGTWTLLAPWKCILPLWYSIVHCPLVSGGNPRFAGLNETMQVAFERSLPWFPADFLGTDAGAEWELERRQRRRGEWARRPKSKRVEWTSLVLGAGRQGEIGDGHACDFEFLFGLAQQQQQGQTRGASAPPDDSGEAMDIDDENPAPTEHKEQDVEIPYLKLLNSIPKSALNGLLSPSPPSQPLPPYAIACVRISLLSRGVVNACARIYRLPSDPIPIPPSSDAEVPASIPPQASSLPSDLRSQWLSRIPSYLSSSIWSKSRPASSPQTQPKRATSRLDDMETRKRLLAQELLTAPQSLGSGPGPNEMDIGGHHPLVPDAKDLIGFVTTGSFCLANGRGAAIGSIAVEKVLADVRANSKEGRLCIVRNAGENVGWIARWEAV